MKQWGLFLISVAAIFGLGAAAVSGFSGERSQAEQGAVQEAQAPFKVTLEVDFGPADQPALNRAVQVQPGETTNDLLDRLGILTKGFVCCSPDDVRAIDGVAVNLSRAWVWRFTINGEGDVSPFATALKPKDVVRWIYGKYEP